MTQDIDAVHEEMRRLEIIVSRTESEGLRARWESGKCMLGLRTGRRLPNGLLVRLAKDLCVHRSELTARMKFAEKYPTDEELTNVISRYRTWFDIKQKALTSREPACVDQEAVSDEDADADEVEVETEGMESTSQRRSFTARLRRMRDFLEGVESAELNEQDVELLDEIAQLAERQRNAAEPFREATTTASSVLEGASS